MSEGNASRVADTGGAEVSDGGCAEGRIGGEGIEEEVVEERGEEGGGAELVSEMEGEGARQGGMRNDGGVEIARQRRL